MSAIVDKIFDQTLSEVTQKKWHKYSYKDLFVVSTKRNTGNLVSNILSASQVYGMVERDEIQIDIKFEKASTTSYKIVEPGDYVIHLRSFQGGFAFSDRNGICSPAYIILKPTSALKYAFLKDYFMSKKFVKSLNAVIYGIRDGRSINVDEFLDLTILIPFIEEQEKIIQGLFRMNEKIENNQRICKLFIKQKEALLKRMFI